MREIVIVAVACFLIGIVASALIAIGVLKAAANDVFRTQIHSLAT
jgi:hypothetical protein